MLRIDESVDQKCEVKMDPRSEVIVSGGPCSRTTWDTKSLANSGASVVLEQGMKWLILVIRSTNTRIESMPHETGRSVMKSQVSPFQGVVGTGSEASSP